MILKICEQLIDMGEAAKISLKAIGKQDTHLLSKDPEESFFNYKKSKCWRENKTNEFLGLDLVFYAICICLFLLLVY